jgi:hypothetical protein
VPKSLKELEVSEILKVLEVSESLKVLEVPEIVKVPGFTFSLACLGRVQVHTGQRL